MPDEAQLLKDVAPEEYREAGYLKDLIDKPWKEAGPLLFKKLHNAQELIGKKASSGLPASDAPEEDWDKFFDGIKAASPDDYKIPVKEGAKADPVFLKAVQQSFLDGKINTRQAGKFMARFSKEMEAYSAAQAKTATEAKTKRDAEFDTLAKSALGEQNKAVMARARKEMEEHAPATLKPYIADLDDKGLVIMAGVIDGILQKYASEDDLDPSKNRNNGGGGSKRAEAQKLNAEVMKMKGFEPDYESKRAALRQLYKEAAEESGKK